MGELFDARFNADDRPLTRDQLIAAMRDADVLVPTVTDHIDAAMIAEAGDRIGLIASFGAGIEHIDLHAARERRIMVTNTPGVFTEDTADMTMAMIVTASRRFSEGVRLLREGNWTGWAPAALLGHRISGKRLAIIGSTLRPRSIAYKTGIARELREQVWPLIEAGTVRPVIHTVFAAEQAAQAHALMESSVHVGKIVLDWTRP